MADSRIEGRGKSFVNFDAYLAWLHVQSCVDCGTKYSDKGDKWWVTETQCMECWKKYGTPENRKETEFGNHGEN